MTEYLIPTGAAETELVEKRSRFIGHVWPVDSEEEARGWIEAMKKKYYDARHNCWCYRIKEGGVERYSDDGEPQGTAGQPMLNVFQREEVTNVCCVVTRYFGGVLLGAGGLVRAYTQSAKDALDAAGISVVRRWVETAVTCPYSFFERVRQEAEAQVELEAGGTAQVFTLPDSVKDYVTVTYTTENENVATYQDGVVTAVGAGKTIVTATVTAKYDGFQMAYSTAVEVLGQPEPTPEPGDVDKTLLEKTIAYAEKLDTTGVTDSAVAVFQKALAQAKAVMADTDATQEQVNAAWDDLLEGIWGLGLTQGDKTLLEQLIAKADGMMADADKYVETNWQQLVDALAAAKDVAADGDAMDEDIQPVAQALLNAILAQRFKADKSILEDLIGKAEGMDLSGCTAESVAAFRTALATAQAVMADATLSEDDQKTVDKAVAALTAAMNGLTAEGETQPSDQPESSQNPETTDQPQATEKPENVPQTGDSAQLMGYVAALATAVMALGAVAMVRRRRRN